jgi:hypothetical protein
MSVEGSEGTEIRDCRWPEPGGFAIGGGTEFDDLGSQAASAALSLMTQDGEARAGPSQECATRCTSGQP